MKANELMIGDWVIDKAVSDNPVQVLQINQQKVHYNRGMGYMSASIKHLVPIPLNREILEKNGFVCTQKADEMETAYECWSFHDGLLSIVFEPDVVMLEVHNGGENGNAVRTITYYTDNDIMYLHELQHALRLCKIEKTIEL